MLYIDNCEYTGAAIEGWFSTGRQYAADTTGLVTITTITFH